MTRTSIQTSFHRIETGLHHVPSSPQFFNSSRVKHHLLLFILIKYFCEHRHSKENPSVSFLAKNIQDKNDEHYLPHLGHAMWLMYEMRTSLPSPSALSCTILPTGKLFLSTTLALNPQGMNQMQIEELWTKYHLCTDTDHSKALCEVW